MAHEDDLNKRRRITHPRGFPRECTWAAAVAVWLAAAPAAVAQGAVVPLPNVTYEKILLPTVVNQPISGAFGSIWVTRLEITNGASVPISVYPFAVGTFCDACAGPPVPANTTFSAVVPADQRGMYIFVDQQHILDVQITLRAQDLSRQSQTWGTNIPVVRERDFVKGTVRLVDVPANDHFRQTLRVYGANSEQSTPVRIRLYGLTLTDAIDSFGGPPDVLLGQLDTQLQPADPPHPAFAEVATLDLVGSTTGFSRVRIDVASLVPDDAIWAFVSVTNNDTQHVTITEPLR